MILIFCTSYMQIPFVIDLIEEKKIDFKVITSSKAIAKNFSEWYSSGNVIKLPKFSLNFKNPVKLLVDIAKLKYYQIKYLLEIKRLKPQELYFFFIGFCGFEAWIIKKLSGKTKIFYRPAKNTRTLFKDAKKIKSRLKAYLLQLIYGAPSEAKRYGNDETVFLSEKFISQISAQLYTKIQDNENLNKFFSRTYSDVPEFEILLLVGGIYNVDDSEHIEKFQMVCDTLRSICSPNLIAVKQHPGHIFTKMKFPNEFLTLPDHIPANLLIFKSPIVIAYTSGTLHEAANLGDIAISLIYIIKSTCSAQAEAKRLMFLLNTEPGRRVQFPKSIEELKEICLRALKKKQNLNVHQ